MIQPRIGSRLVVYSNHEPIGDRIRCRLRVLLRSARLDSRAMRRNRVRVLALRVSRTCRAVSADGRRSLSGRNAIGAARRESNEWRPRTAPYPGPIERLAMAGLDIQNSRRFIVGACRLRLDRVPSTRNLDDSRAKRGWGRGRVRCG